MLDGEQVVRLTPVIVGDVDELVPVEDVHVRLDTFAKIVQWQQCLDDRSDKFSGGRRRFRLTESLSLIRGYPLVFGVANLARWRLFGGGHADTSKVSTSMSERIAPESSFAVCNATVVCSSMMKLSSPLIVSP